MKQKKNSFLKRKFLYFRIKKEQHRKSHRINRVL